MAKLKRELKWHEEILSGAISGAIGITFLFNGFTYLTSLFIDENGIKGGPTGQKGIVALLSLIENSWWKYLVVIVFIMVGFLQIRDGILKYKSEKGNTL